MELSPRDAELAREQEACGLLSVSTAADTLGRSKWAVYGLIRRNRISYVRKGRRLFLEAAVIQARIPAGQAEPDHIASEPLATSAVPGTWEGQRELPISEFRGPHSVFICY
jgi:excisionase family DNA binding protein